MFKRRTAIPMDVSVMLLGDSGCGKTSIITCYKNGKIPRESINTIGVELYTDQYIIGNSYQKVKYWDCAGGSVYRGLIKHYYIGCKIFIIIFDITNERSYKNIKKWISDIKVGNPDPIIYIVGNKVDLPNKTHIRVDKDDHPYPYYFVSAKNNIGIKNLFEQIHTTIVDKGFSNFNYLPYLKTPILTLDDLNKGSRFRAFQTFIKKYYKKYCCCFSKRKKSDSNLHQYI